MRSDRRHSLLREEVSVGAAVLQSQAVSFAAHAVSSDHQRAIVIRQRRVLQHRHIPQEGVRIPLHLRGATHKHDKAFNAPMCG